MADKLGRKPRFRLNREGWRYLSNPAEMHLLRGLPGVDISNCTVGPFCSLDAAYDGVRCRLGLAA